ncbi:MAG: carbohydrate porin [Verrucomicrobia bacterium]|nr:carbohydrate porin [Verrucomicrobiota bacterium]MDE3047029.1 carbohydrate porin [Verrucomicrobiota bacterium]
MRWTLYFCLLAAATFGFADDPTYGISSNPGAVNITVGTGALGRRLKIPESSGVRLGGFWMCDGNPVLSGTDKKQFTGNNLLILDLSIDLNQAMHWKGGYFGTEFLQFNGQATNVDAGCAQGFNSITGDPPLNRSELYQLWILQKFCDDKFSIRIGKTAPIYHFNNVSKPVPTENAVVFIPSVSGLIFTPLFVNTTLLGAIGGYYNSVYGVVATMAPIKEAYINVGVFDGNLAKGVQTGLKGPHFNGYYFSIMEVGYGWASAKPGIAAIGGWYQSGRLKNAGQVQTGTGGFYFFGSQALWIKESHTVSQGNLSGFVQFGWNNSRTLPMNLYIGGGLSGFALIPKRPNDSFGMGIAWSRLNRHIFERHSELMLQAYYQMAITNAVFFEPVLSYIPNPGIDANHSNVCAITARLTVLF